ncbi:MAG: 30S ribosome-binding factor RbfA [Thermoanaerobaculia bacterium]
MNKKDIRLRKMEAQILHIFSLKAIEANDERIKMVIFTRISMAEDLRSVNVFFRVLKEGQGDETLKALNNAKGYFKMALRENSFFRFIPEISFCYDNF